ncbi:MAG: O-antigen ligase family protein [Planctomyces sp.]|nr:O-antigen ligase family protein [Planctomyces sp.]
MVHGKSEESVSGRLRISELLETASLSAVVLTVCALPWILGGVLPVARLVLLAGTVLAAILAMLGRVLASERNRGLPMMSVVLVGMAGIGLIQLLPIYQPPEIGMEHSANVSNRGALLQNASAEKAGLVSRSVSPADTRLQVVQWLSLAVLLTIIADSEINRKRLIGILVVLTANGAAIAVAGILQMYGEPGSVIGASLRISDNIGFGPFVNPNNASGWLCIHLGAAIALMILVFGRVKRLGYSNSFGTPSLFDQLRSGVDQALQRFAQLTSLQILVLLAVIVILTGAIGTMSRGGMIAAILSTLVCVFSRMNLKQSLILLIPVSLVLVLTAGLMTLLELDTLAVSELRTLRDPSSAVTGRLMHWADTFGVVLDFPLLGTGQGAYRLSTLPYQRHYWQNWFMNADNQYLEWLVESGVFGLAICLLMGGLLLKLTARLSVLAKSQRGLDGDRLFVCGLIGIVLLTSQTISAVFDYGIMNPSNSAALALLTGVMISTLTKTELAKTLSTKTVRSSSSHNASAAETLAETSWVVIVLPGYLNWLLRLSVFAGLLLLMSDVWHATAVNFASIPIEKLLLKSPTPELLNALPEMRSRLDAAIRNRPDDLRGLSSLVQADEAIFRWALIRELSGANPPDGRELEKFWDASTPPAIAQRVAVQQLHPPTPESVQFSRVLKSVYDRHPWGVSLDQADSVTPLQPHLYIDRIHIDAILKHEKLATELSHKLMFVMPSDARRLYQAGFLYHTFGELETAEVCLRRSLAVSERFRIPILENIPVTESSGSLVSKYGPESYADSVVAARTARDQRISEELWKRADVQWSQLGDNRTRRDNLERSQHLELRDSLESSIRWLQQCVADAPEDRDFGLRLATLFELNRQENEAMNELMRLQYFFPDDPLVEKAIAELSETMTDPLPLENSSKVRPKK